ncbi:MAG: alpha-mannosidase [Candidatus Brocadiia bacterium]
MAEAPDRDVTVHMVGNAHIDPVWLWRAEEGLAEVRDTCRAALERMDETPGFTFSRSSAAVYQWLQTYHGELFERIRRRVVEGRWCIVGGWWVQADCNLPCGESFVRQALYGKRYFAQAFGADVGVGYNVDAFGHTAQLPQLLSKCGLDSYVFFRPGPHEKELPAGLFLWQAPDGSQVVACRPPGHYNTGPEDIGERIREAAAQAPLGLGHVMCFYGVGDHGGGPTKANIASILEAADDPQGPNVAFSTPDRFFQAVAEARDRLPVVAGELQHHARGCYTVLAAVKEANHRAEQLLLAAERFAAIAAAVFHAQPRQDELRAAWHTVLFHQFHDILAGTSIPEAYEDAWPQYDEACRVAMGVLTDSLETIGTQVDTVGPGDPLVFFNPLAWERVEVVEVEPQEEGRPAVLDPAYQEVPSQVADGHLVFRVRVPPLGFACYRLDVEREAGAGESALAASPTTLENQALRLELDPRTGLLASLRDRRSGAELLAGQGSALVVLRDPSDTWAHGVDAFRDEEGRFEPVGEPELVEDGPARAAIRARYRWGESTAEQTFYLADGLGRVDLCLVVDWRERQRMLKLAVPTAIERPVATFEVPYGAVVRPATGEEEPLQRWLDLSGQVGDTPAGLALANDGKYGADVLGGEMRLSLLRSPPYAFHHPAELEPGKDYRFTDQGTHVVRCRLVPHAGSWADAAVVAQAQALSVPLYFRYETVQDGTLPPQLLGVEVEPPTVALAALKQAEDGEGLVVRIYETAGRACQARLDLRFAETTWQGAMGPFEIKTLHLDLERKRVEEVDLLERRS